MTRIYVLYDSTCGFCGRISTWLTTQPSFVPLIFIPLQSPEVGCRFPGVEALQPDQELVVISDEGDIWRGEGAWIMVLWALREYREWSQRLASPMLMPLARRACEIISENRHRLSLWYESGGIEEVRRGLTYGAPQEARNEGYCKPR